MCVLYNSITQVILSTGISYGAKLNEKYHLLVINDVGGILPGKWYVITSSLFIVNEMCLSHSYKPTLPVGSIMFNVFTDAFVIGIVSFVINIAQAKVLAKKNGYSIHSDQVSISDSLSLSCLSISYNHSQELFAYGIMNIGGSFTGSIPTAGALSRTVLQAATGGNTQV